jgi:zona occludens toxin (predicted ATPase)
MNSHAASSIYETPATYRVAYGWAERADFATFDEALAYYRRTPSATGVTNLDRYDGERDGLTAEQRDEVQS